MKRTSQKALCLYSFTFNSKSFIDTTAKLETEYAVLSVVPCRDAHCANKVLTLLKITTSIAYSASRTLLALGWHKHSKFKLSDAELQNYLQSKLPGFENQQNCERFNLGVPVTPSVKTSL